MLCLSGKKVVRPTDLAFNGVANAIVLLDAQSMMPREQSVRSVSAAARSGMRAAKRKQERTIVVAVQRISPLTTSDGAAAPADYESWREARWLDIAGPIGKARIVGNGRILDRETHTFLTSLAGGPPLRTARWS